MPMLGTHVLRTLGTGRASSKYRHHGPATGTMPTPSLSASRRPASSGELAVRGEMGWDLSSSQNLPAATSAYNKYYETFAAAYNIYHYW